MQNALGKELTEAEAQLWECFQNLHRLVRDHGDELEPFEERNALKALAALWQVANGLGMEPPQLYDVGA